MKPISDMPVEEIAFHLAQKLAENEIEFMEEDYKEEAEYYASEGVTLKSHMTSEYADEGLASFIDESLSRDILEQSQIHFKKLILKKYKK